jgi:hypothetical protein
VIGFRDNNSAIQRCVRIKQEPPIERSEALRDAPELGSSLNPSRGFPPTGAPYLFALEIVPLILSRLQGKSLRFTSEMLSYIDLVIIRLEL